MNSLGDMVVRILGDLSDFDKKLGLAQSKMKTTGENLAKVGKNLTMFVTLPLLGIGAAAVKSSADMEMLEASFKTMLGSASKAAQLMTDLKKMAAATPFETGDLANATKTLLAYRISQEKVLPVLSMLGDIAQGNSQKLGTMAEVFGRITANGRLQGEELNRLIDVGFNPLSIIAEKTGKSMIVLRQEMEKGQITAAMIQDAFRTATSQGGQFYKGMETASKTLTGLISTMKDDIATVGRSFVEDLMPVIKDIVKGVSELAAKLAAMSPEAKKTTLVFVGLAAAIGPVIIAISGLAGALAVLVANPVVLALVGIVAGITAIAVACDNAKNKAEAMHSALNGKSSDDETRKQLKLVNAELDKQVKERERIAKLQGAGSNAGILKALDLEIGKLKGQQLVLIDNLKDMEQKAAREASVAAEAKKATDALTASLKKQVEPVKELTIQELKEAEAAEEAAYIKNVTTEEAYKAIAAQRAEAEAVAALDAAYVEARDASEDLSIDGDAAAKAVAASHEKAAEDTAAAWVKALGDIQATVTEFADTMEKTNGDIVASALSASTDILENLEGDYGPAGKIAAAVIKFGVWLEEEMTKNAKESSQTAAQYMAENFSAVQVKLIDLQIERNNLLLDATLSRIDKELQAELKKAGLLEKTDAEVIAEKLKKAQEAGDQEAIDELTREQQKQAILDQYEKEKQAAIEATAKLNRKLARERAIMEQKIAVAQAKIDEQKAIAELGWGNQDKKNAIKVMYGELIDLIRSIPLPALASGSGFVGGGEYLVGEQGPETVRLPSGAQVVNAFDTERMLASPAGAGDNIHLVVQLDSKPFLDKIFPATKNKTILISAGAVV